MDAQSLRRLLVSIRENAAERDALIRSRAAAARFASHGTQAAAAAKKFVETLDARIAALDAETADIRRAVELVPDVKERSVLVRRYLNGETWEQIAAALSYCQRQIRRIHAAALSSLAAVLEAPETPADAP